MRGLRLLTLGLVSVVAMLAARPAKAGLLVEPYLGYELGKLEINGLEFDLTSPALGARLAYTFPVLFVGVDYNTLLSGSAKDNVASLKWDASGSQLFLEVGAELPLLRAYVGYGLTNTFEVTTLGSTYKFESGTAIKAGVGAKILPMVAINAEYLYSEYDKLNGTSVSGTKPKSNFYMINVSVPFNL